MGPRTRANNCLLATLLLVLFLLSACAAPSAPTATPIPTAINTPTIAAEHIRRPAVAGAFYPAKPQQLQEMVNELLQRAPKVDQKPIALIVPHAGYVYSGAVAATAFKQVEGREYDAVVVLGNNHRAGDFRKIAIWPSGAYSTPVGLVPVTAGGTWCRRGRCSGRPPPG